MSDKKAKILVLRFSSIGDIVLTTPVVRNLKNTVKGVEIHFLTKTSFQGLLKNNPYVDKVWHFNKDLNEVIPHLLKEKYDYVVDLHKNMRTLSLKKQLKAKALSFDKLNVQKFLLTTLKINRLPEIHIVDRYLNSISSLGVSNDELGLDYFPDPGSQEKAQALFDKIPKNYVVVVVGAAHYTKVPTVEKYTELLSSLDKTFVLIGGQNEVVAGESIQDKLGKELFNFCGKTTLDLSALLISRAEFVITPDTGMMHIAAAYQRPIISLWGNTVPEFGMTPYYRKQKPPSYIAEVKGLSCRPCSKIGYESCPKKHFNCIKQIDVQKIKSWVESL